MPELLDRPKVFERGTSPQRHPWFAGGGFPPIGPVLPPEPADDPEPDKGHCPACGNVKAFICRCGYDWDNLEWVSRA
jgi:hypothetical protein